MPSIVEINQLAKIYGDFTAVKGFSFQIECGEIFSLLGSSGAGKTTTISTLSYLLPASTGGAVYRRAFRFQAPIMMWF